MVAVQWQSAFHQEKNRDQPLAGRMFMVNVRQVRSLTPGLSVGAAAAALALMLVLTVVTAGAAHAQSFQVIYTFSGGPDGAQPYAGLTINRGNLYGTTS